MSRTTTSFLHAASAKIMMADDPRDADPLGDGRRGDGMSRAVLAGALRLLLVEEAGDGAGGPAGAGGVARSLAMDAACSLASESSVPCRGCRGGAGIVTDAEDDRERGMACRCCKVALLVPGAVDKRKRKRRRRSNGSMLRGGEAAKIAFPMSCSRDGMDDGNIWDPNVLGQIQIKYVNSFADVRRYLAYAPSLPGNMQPLDGIFLLGLGELMSRNDHNGIMECMEFTNIRKFECLLCISPRAAIRNAFFFLLCVSIHLVCVFSQ